MSGKGPLRILHVGKFYPPHPGGIESHLKTLSEEQRKTAEVQVLVAGPRWRGELLDVNGVEVMRLATPLTLHGTPIVPAMAGAIRRARPSLVHLHFPNPMAAVASLASRVPVPVVVSWHSDVVRQRRAAAALAPLLSMVLRRCSAIIVGSEAYIAGSAVLNANRRLCRVIPYGIRAADLENPDLARVADLRRRHGERIVFAAGRLIYYKGFEYLVRAMAGVQAKLLIAGEGPLRGALEAEARRLGISDRIAFLGRLDDIELKSCYHASDIFVLPSTERSESFGIVQLEAMACGKPVINTQIDSAVPHVSLDRVTGLTVPPGDSAALAAAINALFADPARRAEMGAAARRRVLESFSADAMARLTLDVYTAALSGSPR